MVDLQEEKQFAEAELHENLSFEKEQNKQLRSELEAQKTESANNVSIREVPVRELWLFLLWFIKKISYPMIQNALKLSWVN